MPLYEAADQLMNQKPDNSIEWTPCPQGTLARFSVGQKRHRTLLKAQKWGGMFVLLLAVATGSWSLFNRTTRPTEYHFGGISCSEIRQRFPEYLAGQVSPETAAQFQVHLAECPNCQEFMREMMPMDSPPMNSPGEVSFKPPACPHCRAGYAAMLAGLVESYLGLVKS